MIGLPTHPSKQGITLRVVRFDDPGAPTVDEEFRSLVPGLIAHDWTALRDSIREYGVLDPLVVWAGRNVLLDGHNRLAACRDLGVEFEIVEIDFETREAAHDFVLDRALARRNLTREQLSYLRGLKHRQIVSSRALNLGSQGEFGSRKKQDGEAERARGNSCPAGRTADHIAKTESVCARTVKSDAAYSKHVDAIAETAGTDARDAILSGHVRLTRAEAKQVAERSPASLEDVRATRDEIREARKPLAPPQPTSTDERPFVQKGVKRVIPTDDGKWIAARELACGHTQIAKRRKPYTGPTGGTKSAPCYACGSGTRAPSDARKSRSRALSRVRAAARCRTRSAGLVDAVDVLAAILATRPTPSQEGLWERGSRALNVAALRDDADVEPGGEKPLTREQSKALAGMGR